jgi:hypothetical protein
VQPGFAGAGPSRPEEYEAAQHVDPDVIGDIAAWLTSWPPFAGGPSSGDAA